MPVVIFAAELRAGLRDLRRNWRQFLLTHLLAWGLSSLLLTPLILALLKLFLVAADERVLTDEDILLFLLHPVGLLGLLVVGSVSLAVWFAQLGAMSVIACGALCRQPISCLTALRYVVDHRRQLWHLGSAALLRLLLIAAPLLLVLGWLIWSLLSRHDVNFYLAQQPLEFLRVLRWGGLLTALYLLLALRQLVSWSLALPLTLFGTLQGRDALAESARQLRRYSWPLTLVVLLWMALLRLLQLGVAWLAGFIGSQLAPLLASDSLLLAGGVLLLALIITVVINLTLSIGALSLFIVLLLRLYHGLKEPMALHPLSRMKPVRWQIWRALTSSWGVGCCLAVLLPGLSAVSYFVLEHIAVEDTAVVIAHRGASQVAPENSLAAFEEAVRQSADWIELDVQLSGDGTVVVVHDSDFMKVARRPLKVWQATAQDLAQIDIGSWHAPEFAAERTPTLGQVLALAKGRAGVVIELKYYPGQRPSQRAALAPEVIKEVVAAGMQQQVMIMSLSRPALGRFARLEPDWPRGLLSTAALGDITRLQMSFLALNTSAATPAVIRRAHRRGLRVFVWTVNDPIQMSVMLSRGVDGLITDVPGLAKQVLALRAELSLPGRLLVWIAGESGLLQMDASTAQSKSD